MQTELFIEQEDFSNEKVLIGLSGGINSAAVLIWLSQYPEEYKPKELHLFYSHFKEHSPDTFQFVKDLIKYARLHFKNVFVKVTRNSVLDFFREQKFIPHPTLSPCTRVLKLLPLQEYMIANGITVDLVGFIREETRRAKRMASAKKLPIIDRSIKNELSKTHFIISDKSDDWCFRIVKGAIGWYPKIYLIKYKGKRLFKHNNCLPCKNMTIDQLKLVELYYPEYHKEAMDLSYELINHWGRNEVAFFTAFGRDINAGCEICNFD